MKVSKTYRHRLGANPALKAVKGLVTDLETEYRDHLGSLFTSWGTTTGTIKCSVRGLEIVLSITCAETIVLVTGDVPFLAKGKLERFLDQHLPPRLEPN